MQIESDTGIKTKTIPFDAGATSAQLTIEKPSPFFTDTLTLKPTTDAADAADAADADKGNMIIITKPQAKEADDLLKDVADAAGPQLAEIINREAQALDFPSLGGKNMNQFLAKIAGRIEGQVYLPITSGN